METNREMMELIESWQNLALIVRFVGEHPEKLEALINIVLDDRIPNSWRAAWMIDKIHEKHPELIVPFLPVLTRFVLKTKNEGKRRHLLKIISMNQIPEDQVTDLLEFSLEVFSNASIPIAVRVHAMQTLFNIAMLEPEFSNELIQIIEQEIEYRGSAGIASRGRKLIRRLSEAAVSKHQ